MSVAAGSNRWRRRGRPSLTVGSLTPSTFQSYLRVLHPAFNGDEPVGWRRIADLNARPFDPRTSSFYDISGVLLHSGQTSVGWDAEPFVGGPDPATTRALIGVLERYTTTPDDVVFGVWDGYSGGSIIGAAIIAVGTRSYRCRRGRIEEVLSAGPGGRTANVWWPADEAWVVVSDVDLPASFVGVPLEAAHALTRTSGLEMAAVSLDTTVSEPVNAAH